jgi:hypothetical protein
MSSRWSPSNELAASVCELISNLNWDNERFPQAKLGRVKAKQVLYAAVASETLPKPGYEIYLGWCWKTVSYSHNPKRVAFYLSRKADSFYVTDSYE